MSHFETNYYTASGGTIVSQTTSVAYPSGPYVYTFTDTVKVIWNGSGPRYLALRRTAMNHDNHTAGWESCYSYDTLWAANGPANITGPSTGCPPTSLNYSVTADTGYTYTWAVLNGGTLQAGQGTPNVSVNWTGNGALVVEKSFLWCPITYYDTLYFVNGNTTVSLPPTMTVCSGQATPLTPSTTYSTYNWSTGDTTASISVIAGGAYSVTVSNAAGCTASDTTIATLVSSPVPALGPDLQVCPGQIVVLNPGSFSSYAWSNGDTTNTLSPTSSGSYAVTVSDGICSASDTMQLLVNPLPAFTLQADTFLCADTTILLTGPAGMTGYAWSTGGIGQTINISSGGNYSLTVTDANGCTFSDSVTVADSLDCVFPGDADSDGVSSALDVLSIGLNAGMTGPARGGASLLWYGQAAGNWGTGPQSVDMKHSDCDGNGLVDANDTLAVTLNFGQTHSRVSGGAWPSLVLKALTDTVAPGDLALFSVEFGDSSDPVLNAYGLAFQLNLDTSYTSGGISFVDFSNCWFAPPGDQITMTRNGPDACGLVVVRNDQLGQTGHGRVCLVGVRTDSVVPGAVDLHVWLGAATAIDASGEKGNPSIHGDTVVIAENSNAISTSITQAITLYPNPAVDQVVLAIDGSTFLSLDILDLTGRVYSTLTDLGPDGIIDVSRLQAGTYLIRVHTDSGPMTKKLVITR